MMVVVVVNKINVSLFDDWLIRLISENIKIAFVNKLSSSDML
jgi:hypothetical protein